MKYKVIKEFGSAKKGDILSDENREFRMVSFYIEEDGCTRAMSLDYDTADSLCEDEYLEAVEDSRAEQVNEEALTLVNTLLEQYDHDLNATKKKASEGEVPPCVEVEATTVYANLTKVLNRIKDVLECKE